MPESHIIIIGGTSVNNSTDHDNFPLNYINPAIRRGKAIGKSAIIIMFTPSYERRVENQKNEHTSVDNPTKNKQHFIKIAENAAKDNGFAFHKITQASELTKHLKAAAPIASIDYFGHSNVSAMFLEYSSVKDNESTETWSVADSGGLTPTDFTKTAVFASYGCYQGEAGGLADKLRETWRIRTIGSRGDTSYKKAGVHGGPTFPTSASGYVEYPAPAVDAKGKLVYPLPTAKVVTYSATQPPH